MKKPIARIIVLAGQSNAVGVGYTKYLQNYYANEVIDKFYVGYDQVPINYYSHDIKSNGFVKTTINCTELNKDTCGPELGIAKNLTSRTKEKFFIVKCAFGGTSLYNDWLSPSSIRLSYPSKDNKSNRLEVDNTFYLEKNKPIGWCYNELVCLLKSSIEILENNGYAPKISAFFWMQGESDASEITHVNKYEQRYDNLIKDIKAEFFKYIMDCVYVDGGISSLWKYYKEINTIKRAYSNRNNYHYIDTIKIGLTTNKEPHEQPDLAHYDVDSIIKLGEMFAQKIEVK